MPHFLWIEDWGVKGEETCQTKRGACSKMPTAKTAKRRESEAIDTTSRGSH